MQSRTKMTQIIYLTTLMHVLRDTWATDVAFCSNVSISAKFHWEHVCSMEMRRRTLKFSVARTSGSKFGSCATTTSASSSSTTRTSSRSTRHAPRFMPTELQAHQLDTLKYCPQMSPQQRQGLSVHVFHALLSRSARSHAQRCARKAQSGNIGHARSTRRNKICRLSSSVHKAWPCRLHLDSARRADEIFTSGADRRPSDGG